MPEDKTRLSVNRLNEEIEANPESDTKWLDTTGEESMTLMQNGLWEKFQSASLIVMLVFLIFLFGLASGVLLAEREQRVTIETWTEALRVMNNNPLGMMKKSNAKQTNKATPLPE